MKIGCALAPICAPKYPPIQQRYTFFGYQHLPKSAASPRKAILDFVMLCDAPPTLTFVNMPASSFS
jgi:hypothetical protein